MRWPEKLTNYNLWLPELSPSENLLTNYQQKKINWDEYVIRFNQEVLKQKREFIKLVGYLALKFKVTLLCWEKTPEKCHRRLVAEAVKKKFPKLRVVIK